MIEDPSPNAARHHTLSLLIEVPTYGKPTDDTKTAQAIKSILQTGLHARIKVYLADENGDLTEVADRDWRKVV